MVKRNRSEVIKRQRRGRIALLQRVSGGCCQSCGYAVPIALDFHHMGKDERGHDINLRTILMGWKRIAVELAKCVLVCSNCHREIHAGLRECPPQPMSQIEWANGGWSKETKGFAFFEVDDGISI